MHVCGSWMASFQHKGSREWPQIGPKAPNIVKKREKIIMWGSRDGSNRMMNIVREWGKGQQEKKKENNHGMMYLKMHNKRCHDHQVPDHGEAVGASDAWRLQSKFSGGSGKDVVFRASCGGGYDQSNFRNGVEEDGDL